MKLSLPSFIHLSSSLFVNTPVLLIILGLFFAGYAVITSVLMYHWNTYGMGASGVHVARVVFLCGSAFLFIIAGLSIFYF